MKFTRILNALVLAAAVAASAAVARAGTTVQAVRGDIVATSDTGTEKGAFRLADIQRDGTEYQTVTVFVRNLDAGPALDATFEVVLENGPATADLGALRLYGSTKSRGWLRFDTRKAGDFGPADLKPFSGGTLHVQLAGADVATSAIPAFVEVEGPAQPADQPVNAIAFGFGSVVLGDPSAAGVGPVAKVTAFAGNTQWGVDQAIAVGGFAFDRGVAYTVVLTGASEDVLGTFKASWFFGFGGLTVSTRRGDAIPGGSVAALAGRGIEIRDASGTAVLSGTFPSLK